MGKKPQKKSKSSSKAEEVPIIKRKGDKFFSEQSLETANDGKKPSLAQKPRTVINWIMILLITVNIVIEKFFYRGTFMALITQPVWLVTCGIVLLGSLWNMVQKLGGKPLAETRGIDWLTFITPFAFFIAILLFSSIPIPNAINAAFESRWVFSLLFLTGSLPLLGLVWLFTDLAVDAANLDHRQYLYDPIVKRKGDKFGPVSRIKKSQNKKIRFALFIVMILAGIMALLYTFNVIGDGVVEFKWIAFWILILLATSTITQMIPHDSTPTNKTQ